MSSNLRTVPKFNGWSRTYDGGRMTSWFRDGQSRTIQALELKEDNSLLDVGCGTGWAVIRAAQLLGRGKACGIDLSPGMLSKARTNAEGLSNVEFSLADAEAIPYQAGVFDAVLCTNSFHHYSNPDRALKEMRRVLKPGGRLIIRDSDRGACLWVRLWDAWNRHFEKGHIRYYTRAEILGLLEKAGFVSPAVVDFEHHHFRKRKIGAAIYVVRGIKG